MYLLDTNIISNVYNGKSSLNLKEGILGISSITALEFLEIQNNQPTKSNCYIPILKLFPYELLLKRKRPFPKKMTDQVIIYIQNKAFIYFSNKAISLCINEKNEPLFKASIKNLLNYDYDNFLKKFRFLINHNIQSLQLSKSIINRAKCIEKKHNLTLNSKKDLRNSLNDFLILATAIENKAKLITRDNVLNKLRLSCTDISDKNQKKIIYSKHTSSKNYISKDWSYRFRNYF